MLPLNKLWEGYMRDLYSVTQRCNLENALLRADYHGAFLRVVQSKCPSHVGKGGLVVQETLNTFVMIQSDNRPIVIPKNGNVFICGLQLPTLKIEWHLYGDQMRQHAGFRSSRKYKSKPTISL